MVLALAIFTAMPVSARSFSGGNPERGSGVAKSKCTSCHGEDGNSTSLQFPKLAGQNPDYLYEQLQAFQAGARRSDIMSAIVATLSDTDLADVASFYAQQTIRPDRVKDKALASFGKSIFLNGAGRGRAPACAMCHNAAGGGSMPMMMGMMGRGMTANVPNLNGQHAAYTVNQLTRFAAGERQGTVMGRVAASLSETDEKAVAEYLSGLH